MIKSGVYKIVYAFLMFVAGMFLSNLALPQLFGTISLLVLNASLLSLVTGFGADSMILHMLSNKKWILAEAVYFMWRSLAIQIILFLILEYACFLIWGKTLLAGKDKSYFLIELIYFTGLLCTEKFIVLLYGLHKAKIANLILIIVSLTYLFTLGLLYYFRVNFFNVVYLLAIQSCVQGLALFFIFYSTCAVRPKKINLKKLHPVFWLSSVVMITNIVQLLAYRIDFWLLKGFYSTIEVGIYAQANKFANLLWIVPNILAQLLIPLFSQFERNSISKVFRTAFYFNLINVGATIICTVIFYFYFLNSEYKNGLTAFYIMLPGYFLWAGVIYFAAYFSWAGKFYYNLIGSAFCLIIITVADFILIPKYALNGAALANTIAYSFVFLLYIFFLLKKYSFSLNELLILRKKDFYTVTKLLN